MPVSVRNVVTAIFLTLSVPYTVFAEPTANEIANAKSIIYKIPNDTNIIGASAPLNGIVFNNNCRKSFQSGVKSPDVKGVTFSLDNGSLIVRYLDGIDSCDLGEFHGAFKEYDVHIVKDTKNDVTTLALTPFKSKTKDGNFFFRLGGHKTPEFTIEELNIQLKNNSTIGYVLEVDSPYKPESVLSNFKRLWKEEHHDEGTYFNGKKYNKWYRIKLDEDHFIVVFAEVVPYKNGSKAILNINIPIIAEDQSDVIDIANQLSRARTLIINAVNN